MYLITCRKDINGRKSAWSFSGVETETELILARAGIFYAQSQDLEMLKICPFHHSELGIGWRRNMVICHVPNATAQHKAEKGIKADRHLR